MYPPISFPPPSQYTATLFCYSVSSFPLPPSLPSSSSSSSSSMIVAPLFPCAVRLAPLWAEDYSNKKKAPLSTNYHGDSDTSATAIVRCCGLSSCAFVPQLCLSSSSPFLPMSHMMTPPWTSAALSLVVWWPSQAQLFKSVLLSVNGGWEVGQTATAFYILRLLTHLPVLFYLYSIPIPLPNCCLGHSYTWCATDICFCNDVMWACSVTQSCRVSTRKLLKWGG